MPSYYSKRYKNIETAENSFASGGEGEVFDIVSPVSLKDSYCLKVYYIIKRSAELHQKVGFMINHKPPITQKPNVLICWPLDLVYNTKKEFIGFIMQKAFMNSINLFNLTLFKRPRHLNNGWDKFFQKQDHGMLARLKLCVNIATAILLIHDLNKYVFVDFKPQNILITNNGKISLIDLDSIQIYQNNKLQFLCPVFTPEYSPPEQKNYLNTDKPIKETWDRFSLAVVFYQIIFRIHPFTATSRGIYKNCTTIEGKIAQGLFPFGKQSRYISVSPPHSNFKLLPQGFQRLFITCFVMGHDSPIKRPTIRAWGKMFFSEIQLVTNVEKANLPYRHTAREEEITNLRVLIDTYKNEIIDLKNEKKLLINYNKQNNSSVKKTTFNSKYSIYSLIIMTVILIIGLVSFIDKTKKDSYAYSKEYSKRMIAEKELDKAETKYFDLLEKNTHTRKQLENHVFCIGEKETLPAGYDNNYKLFFQTSTKFLLQSVLINADKTNPITIAIYDSTDRLIHATDSINILRAKRWLRVNLNFTISKGKYYLKIRGNNNLSYTSSNLKYPYVSSPITILGASSGSIPNTSYYQYFYDWNYSLVFD